MGKMVMTAVNPYPRPSILCVMCWSHYRELFPLFIKIINENSI
ncbi:hypothetical protein DDI_1286 [Dickeya dianthicola RNS04.9]|nr:hypothetical protein DDI_1286 [Dickeya dianthicola RNS04.9]